MFSRSLVAFIERSVKGKAFAAAVQSARTAKKGVRGSGASLNLSSVRFGGGVAFNPERELHTQEKDAHSNRLHRSLKSSYSRPASEDTAADSVPNSRYYEAGKTGKGIELKHLKERETELSPSLSSFYPSSGEAGTIPQIEGVGREQEESETIFDAGEEEVEMGMELMTREGGKARDEGAEGHLKGVNDEDSENHGGRSTEKERVATQIRDDFMSSNVVHKDILLEKSSRSGLLPQRSFLEKTVGPGGLHSSGATMGVENSSSFRPSTSHQQGEGKKSEGGVKGHLAASARSRGTARNHLFEGPSGHSASSSVSSSSSLVGISSAERSSQLPFSHLEGGNSFQTTEGRHLNVDGSSLTSTSFDTPRNDGDNSEREVQGVHPSFHPRTTPMSNPGVSFSPPRTLSESTSVLPFHETDGEPSDASPSSSPNGGNEAGSTITSGKSVEAYRFLMHHIDTEIAALKRRHTSVTSHRVQLEDQQALRIRELYNFMESPWLLLKTTHPPPLPATGVEVYLKEQMQVMRDNSGNNSSNSHCAPTNHSENSKNLGESSSTPLDLSKEKMLVLAYQKNYSSLPSGEKKIYEEVAKFNAALREEMKRRLSTGCSNFEEFCEQIQECTSSMVREGRLPQPPPGTPTHFLMMNSREESELASVPNRFSTSGGHSFSRRGSLSRGVPVLATTSAIAAASGRDGGDEKIKVTNTTLSSPSLGIPSGGDGISQKSPKGSLSPSVARVMSRGVMRVHHRPVSDTSSAQKSFPVLSHNSSGSDNARYTDGLVTAGGSSSGTNSRFSTSSSVTTQKGFELGKNVTNLSPSSARIGMISGSSSSIAARKRNSNSFNASSSATDSTSSNNKSSNESNTALSFARQQLWSSHSPSRIVAGGSTSAVEKEAHRKSKTESKGSVHPLTRGPHPPTSKTASSSVTSHSPQVQHRHGKRAVKKLVKIRQQKKKAKKSGGKRATASRKLFFKSRGSQKSTKMSLKAGSAVKVSTVSASKNSAGAKLSLRGGKASEKKSSTIQKKKTVGSTQTVAMQKNNASRKTGSRNIGQIHSTWGDGRRGTTTVASSQSGRSSSGKNRPMKAWPPLSFPSSKNTRPREKSSSWSKMGSVVVIDKHRSPSLPLPQVSSRVPTGKSVSNKRKKKSSW